MFLTLGELTYRYRWQVIGLWLTAFIVSIPFLLRVEEPLKVGGFSSPNTESARASKLFEQGLGRGASTIVVLFRSDSILATDPAFGAQVRYALQPLLARPDVVSVVYPEDDPDLISRDFTTAYALVGLSVPAQEAQRDVPDFKAALRTPPDLEMMVAGAPAFYADIETVSQRDLRRAELIAFPFAMAALLIVFGSIVAAFLPLAVGGVGVAGVLVTLFAVAHIADLSIFVLNLATMLGLGLAVDYSLFITSRFREDLASNGGDVRGAVIGTSVTAGRAIFFSGLTVLIGLSGLMLFDFMFLRSVGVSGVAVVFFAVAAAITLLPAMLSVIGEKVDRLSIGRRRRSDFTTGGHFWVRMSGWVMRHPVLVLVPTLALLLLLGSPFRHVRVSSPDATILPRDLPSRQAFDVIVEEFGPGEISPFVLTISAEDGIYGATAPGVIYDLTARLAADPRIDHVKSIAPVADGIGRGQAIELIKLQPGLENSGINLRTSRLASEHVAVILGYSRDYANSDSNKALLSELRKIPMPNGVTLLIGGGTAEIVDVVDQMYGQFPLAILLIVVATYVVLLVLLRSVLLPLKAIVLNAMSIVASYGALVFIFQDGHFERLLGFGALGFVEASLPVIMFCVLFGLSMDYEVFLLTRIREEWDRTDDNAASVALGLQRSGRIITSAALIVVVVTGSFVSADVILIKALGLGIAIAVFVDATLVRALLVPAAMRLMGHWNWWLPAGLERRIPQYRPERAPEALMVTDCQ